MFKSSMLHQSISVQSFQVKLKGFTLIEALIAIFIFSWIGLSAYKILDQIVRAQEVVEKHSLQLANTQRVAWQLGRDFRQMVDRPVIDENGQVLDALVHLGDYNLIEFTRNGWTNPLQWPRSDLQRVAYRIDYHPESNEPDSPFYQDETLYLVRLFWQVLDRTVETTPRQQAMLAGIVDFRTRFWNPADNEWSDALLPVSLAGVNTTLQHAVEVSIVLESEEVLTHIYPVF